MEKFVISLICLLKKVFLDLMLQQQILSKMSYDGHSCLDNSYFCENSTLIVDILDFSSKVSRYTENQSYRVVNGKLFVGIYSNQNAAGVCLKRKEKDWITYFWCKCRTNGYDHSSSWMFLMKSNSLVYVCLIDLVFGSKPSGHFNKAQVRLMSYSQYCWLIIRLATSAERKNQ